MTRIDPATGAATNLPLPAPASNATAVAFDGTNVWTVNSGTNTVSRLLP